MTISRAIKLVGILSFFIITYQILYYRNFNIIFSPELDDLILICSTITLITLIILGTFRMKTRIETTIIIGVSSLAMFLFRAIPNIRLSFPPLQDPYYHFITTQNIEVSHSLTPILSWWYSGIQTQLHWPQMQLLTDSLATIGQVDNMSIFRFQEPLIGVGFFLALFILAKSITKRNDVSMIAALLGSTSEVIIFYQSEYHPQGLAFLFFILILYAYSKRVTSKNVGFSISALIFIGAFIASHHFSSVFIGILAFAMVIFIILMVTLDKNGRRQIDVGRELTFWIIICAMALTYNIYYEFQPLSLFIKESLSGSPFGSLITVGANIPLSTTILNFGKWILILISLIFLFLELKSKKRENLIYIFLYVGILLAGFIGTFVLDSPTDRIIGFSMPFIAIFSSIILVRVLRNGKYLKSRFAQPFLIIGMTLLIITPVTIGIFNSQTPSYFFKTSEVNEYYWYSNNVPSMDMYVESGKWINHTISANSTIGTEFDTLTAVLYYAGFSDQRIEYQPMNSNFDFYLTNPSIHYSEKVSNKATILANDETIYCNNELCFVRSG